MGRFSKFPGRQKDLAVSREVLLGVTICFAQIPESVAFAFMPAKQPAGKPCSSSLNFGAP